MVGFSVCLQSSRWDFFTFAFLPSIEWSWWIKSQLFFSVTSFQPQNQICSLYFSSVQKKMSSKFDLFEANSNWNISWAKLKLMSYLLIPINWTNQNILSDVWNILSLSHYNWSMLWSIPSMSSLHFNSSHFRSVLAIYWPRKKKLPGNDLFCETNVNRFQQYIFRITRTQINLTNVTNKTGCRQPFEKEKPDHYLNSDLKFLISSGNPMN